ncbi:hypothetical protein KHC28_15155 [Ancylobacter sonchi]|nr:hypothetical protein [Ancylobacter sonchi]
MRISTLRIGEKLRGGKGRRGGRPGGFRKRSLILVLIAAATVLAAEPLIYKTFSHAHAQTQASAPANAGPVGRESGLPVPRFVSIKADKVNVRSGPSRDHGVAWVFTRAGLPVEITAEFETWRRIRDSDGAEGWVYHSMLSSRRTALVGPWLKGGPTSLYASRDTKSRVAAQVEPGVLGQVSDCDGTWCRFYGDGFEGFIEQERLWGVYPGEKVD